jgi:Lrp/AsnC family transcriptional regulator for asnA, asnC and gidA
VNSDPPIDEMDRRIIQFLQKNGRAPNTEIAREIAVTETTIRNRVSRLVDEGLIQIVAVPTPKAVGGNISAIVGLSVQLPHMQAIATKVAGFSEVRYVGLSVGRYDIMVEAFFRDQEHLLEFVSTKLGSMKGIVSSETSVILRVAKFSYEWEIP